LEWERRQPIGGRAYAYAYRSQRKQALVDWVARAVRASGCELLGISKASVSPVHIGIRLPDNRRLGATVYAFRSKELGTGGRPADEYEVQVRLMSELAWEEWDHPIGFDPHGVESTAVIGIQLTADVALALDPRVYDPLPMGNSVQFRQHHADAARERGWHVWERGNIPGSRREARTAEGFETCIAVRPDRFVDLLLFEREARDLALDQSLRYQAAVRAGETPAQDLRHRLEIEWGLAAQEILEVIADRRRLGTAVRGGVAELHLERVLQQDERLLVTPIDEDGRPDFEVVYQGRRLLVECKNVLSTRTQPETGLPIVELWKTRGKIPGRLYDTSAFDIVAASMYPQTGRWEFRFRRAADLPRHPDHPNKLHNFHAVDDSWTDRLPVEG
jgi:hypothetical protein